MIEEEIDNRVIAQANDESAREKPSAMPKEYVHDVLLARQRAKEPRESLASVKERLKRQGKLDV